MAKRSRMMNLCAVPSGVGSSLAAWRSPRTEPRRVRQLAYQAEVAQIAEAGKLDALFLADFLHFTPAAKYDVQERLDPIVTLAGLAGLTKHIGLIATASTTYGTPFTLARQFASLHHLSNGRAGWNIVTTMAPAAAANFGSREHPEHDARYDLADEFVDVVIKLWESWREDTIIADRKSGIYIDTSKVHPINHSGEHFTVRGPLNVPLSPEYGRPVLIQAGSSEAGMRLASTYAEIIFTTQYNLADAQAFSRGMKARARALGRNPDDVRILPGLAPVVGRTTKEAREMARETAELATPEAGFPLMTSIFGGLDLSSYDLDAPFPEITLPPNAPRSRAELFINMARAENMTLRQVMQRIAVSSGHRLVYGTPDEIADDMIAWFEGEGADGFNVMAVELPSGLRDFVEHVVPRLQDRGVFRKEYGQGGLRENLGIGLHD
jgi:N-acetyl-S-(2-succino)cysteine monooxygenase